MLLCWKYERLLSAYADGFLPRRQLRAVSRHVQSCWDCREELQELRRVAALLQQSPSAPLPADLQFRIRHRICLERARKQRPTWRWRWQNLMAPFAFPAAAGILAALLIFGTLIHAFVVPVKADSEDVPLNFRRPARLLRSGPIEFNTGAEGLVVEILIDQDGRVADYSILGGTHTPEDIRSLRNLLLFTVFDPATVFGRPTAERQVRSFRRIHVRE